MGWSSGGRLAIKLIDACYDEVGEAIDRHSFYVRMIEAFKDFDCDVLDECQDIDPEFDRALNYVNGRQ